MSAAGTNPELSTPLRADGATSVRTRSVRHDPMIVEYEPQHRESLLRLWRRYFGRWSEESLLRRWAWQFEQNPYVAQRKPFILVGISQATGEVMAHISALPVPLRMNGRVTISLLGSALVADEEARMMGFTLARRLALAAPALAAGMHPSVRKILALGGVEPVAITRRRFTLPLSDQGARCRAARRRFPSWAAPMISPGVARWLPESIAGPRTPSASLPAPVHADIRDLDRFDARYETLWRRFAPPTINCIEKDAAYMNWRYVDCPTQRTVRLAKYRHGKLIGIAVGTWRAETDWMSRPCVVYGEVQDLMTDPDAPEAARPLLVELIHRLADRPIDAVTITGLRLSQHEIVRGLGFAEREDDTYAMAVNPYQANRRCTPEELREDRWYTTAADGDALYSVTI